MAGFWEKIKLNSEDKKKERAIKREERIKAKEKSRQECIEWFEKRKKAEEEKRRKEQEQYDYEHTKFYCQECGRSIERCEIQDLYERRTALTEGRELETHCYYCDGLLGDAPPPPDHKRSYESVIRENELKEMQDTYYYGVLHMKPPSANDDTRYQCPVCHSKNIERITTTQRLVGTATLGLASNTVGKTYRCKVCKHTW